MYALARQPDTDIQAEAATVIANVTAASYEAQARVVADGVVQLLLYLCASQHDETRAAASRAVANLTQNVDNEPILREARCQEALFQHVASSSSDVKWQCRRALANLEASRLLVGLRRFGGGSVVVVEPGVIADICKHADAANVGAQREVARALANLAAAEENHELLKAEGGLSLCMDLVVSNSSEVQQQATRCIGNLALASNDALPQHMAEEGVLELLVPLRRAGTKACKRRRPSRSPASPSGRPTGWPSSAPERSRRCSSSSSRPIRPSRIAARWRSWQFSDETSQTETSFHSTSLTFLGVHTVHC